MNRHAKRLPGFSLVEMIFFGAIAALVLVGAIGILGRGSRILEISRQSSGSQTDLRALLETMTEDANELVYLLDADNFDASGTGEKTFKFVVRSTRVEQGIDTLATPTLRRIEYRVKGASGDSKLRECERKVTVLSGGSGSADGASATRVLVRSLSSLRIWPVVAVPLPSRKYTLVGPADGRADDAGSTVACLVVDVTMGEAPTARSADQSAVTSVVTKLWCRNRVIEISRGGLQ